MFSFSYLCSYKHDGKKLSIEDLTSVNEVCEFSPLLNQYYVDKEGLIG